MGVLDKILGSKRGELAELRARALPAPPSAVPPFNLNRDANAPLRLFCEIKRRSPSAGPLSTHLSIAERAIEYERGGASLISVLCDGPFFDGSFEDLLEARRAQTLPLLCKEFIIDECQLDAAQAYGASAVLLIVRCLPEPLLTRFIAGAIQRKLTPLVEVFNEEESRRAQGAGAQVIGVNARDLDTLEMNSAKAAEVMQRLPNDIVACHLSGLKSPEDLRQVAKGRADAALMGEVLMREAHPMTLLSSFVAAAHRDLS